MISRKGAGMPSAPVLMVMFMFAILFLAAGVLFINSGNEQGHALLAQLEGFTGILDGVM